MILEKEKGGRKMRKVSSVLLIVILILSFTVTGFAADAPNTAKSGAGKYPPGPIQKAERGMGNIFFGWTEIPKRVVDKTKEYNNPIKGLLLGTFQGSCKAFARIASGVVDVATFPIGKYEKPSVLPDMPAAE